MGSTQTFWSLPSPWLFSRWILFLYTVISMFVAGKMIDVTITGFNLNKSVMIISNMSEEIGGRIINEMHRGVTYFSGWGAFTGRIKPLSTA